MDFETDIVEISNDNWFVYKVKEGKFIGYGDLSKLEFLVGKFKELVESAKKPD